MLWLFPVSLAQFMDYQVKYKCIKNGFSLVEVIIVIGIFALFLGMSDSIYKFFGSHSNLEMTTNSVVEALRFAESNSVKANGDSNWGVKFFNNQAIVFKGSSYVTRDSTADKSVTFPGDMVLSGADEVVFSKFTGWTSNAGTTTVTNNDGLKNIYINAKGTITY